MPSGLTYKINSGEDMSLRGFALKCVTQLGAGYFATSQGEKEMPIDKAPVLEVSDYHIKNLEKSKKELEYWTKIQNDKEAVKRLYDKYCKKTKKTMKIVVDREWRLKVDTKQCYKKLRVGIFQKNMIL